MTSSERNEKNVNTNMGLHKDRSGLRCTNVSKRFGNEQVIRNFNLVVTKGQLAAIFAPEFSGKTTLAKMMSGLLYPTGGYVLIESKKAGTRTNKFVSYLPEVPYVKYDNSVYDLIGIYSRFFPDFRSKKAYTLLKSFKINPRTRFENMSATAVQIVETIMVASRKASLYIFDEPIVNVNGKYRKSIIEIISKCKKDGAVVVLSQEPVGFDEAIDKVVFLKHGDIILSAKKEDVERKYFQPVSSIYREVYK